MLSIDREEQFRCWKKQQENCTKNTPDKKWNKEVFILHECILQMNFQNLIKLKLPQI